MVRDLFDSMFSMFSGFGAMFGVPLFTLMTILVIMSLIGNKRAKKLKQDFMAILKQNGLNISESDIICTRAFLGFDFEKRVFCYTENLKEKNLKNNLYSFDDIIEVLILRDDNVVISNKKENLLSAEALKEKMDALSYPAKDGLHTMCVVIKLKDENKTILKMIFYKSAMMVKLDHDQIDYKIHVPTAKCFEKLSKAMIEPI